MAGKEQIMADQIQTLYFVISAFAAVEPQLSRDLLIRKDGEDVVAVRIVGDSGVLPRDEFQFSADAEFDPQNRERKKLRIDNGLQEMSLSAADRGISLKRCVRSQSLFSEPLV